MNKAAEHSHSVSKAVDAMQQRLTDYACSFNFADLPPAVVHAAKARVIDNLGVLMGGLFDETGRILRNVALQMPHAAGATIVGTRMKTTPDMAALVNASTMRSVEFSDVYHWPGGYQGHPSDTLTPLLAVAEHTQVSGRDYIAALVLAYEVFCRMCDVFPNRDFDNTNFCCLGTAVAAGKLLNLTAEQLAHGISMAVVPNNTLRQIRLSHKVMLKVVAAGLAGRAGVFAALLARAGMEGPHLPFEGKAGWCEHIARKRISLDTLGGGGTPFKILATRIRHRSAMGETISSIIAAEKIAPLNLKEVQKVTVEVYGHALESVGSKEHDWCWNPHTRESADQSIPYLVAATLMDGTISPQTSFNDAHLGDPQLRALMQKIEVVENEEFTKAYASKTADEKTGTLERLHRSRVTVVTNGGQRLTADSGGDGDDLSAPKSDAHIEQKFRGLTEDSLGTKRVNAILDRLWHMEEVDDMGTIPGLFAVD